jgi:hypothetical protein
VPARYRLHDLVRSFAREVVLAEEPEPATRAALGRLLDHYLGVAAAAGERGLRARAGRVRGRAPRMSG